jgi:hypothetical protein
MSILNTYRVTALEHDRLRTVRAAPEPHGIVQRGAGKRAALSPPVYFFI